MRNVILIILDGGESRKKKECYFKCQNSNFNYYWNNFPKTELCAHGKCVGLPDTQDGNSEAGHMNLGAGRIVLQDSVYISESIKDGTFSKILLFGSSKTH